MLDAGLYLFYALLIAAVALSVALPLLHAIKNPKNAAKSALGVGGLVVLFAIAYAISGSNVTPSQAALGVTESSSRLIGAGMVMMYFSFVATAIIWIYSEISKSLK